MEYLIIIIVAYLLGSIPTAYLVVKKVAGLDIRNSGSGNVGAYNSTEVTSSWIVGVIVFLVDAAKGLLAVYIAATLLPDEFTASATALIIAVFAHCYNPWLKFKGGRGLATAAGGSFMLSPMILGLWIILWIIAYVFRKEIHFGNISATVLSIALLWSSGEIINKYTYPPAESVLSFQILATIMLLIILARHWESIKLMLSNFKVKR